MDDRRVEIHAAAAGLTLLIFGGLWVLWTYPIVLVYLLLGIVAVFTYSALYLILAAKMDPERQPTTQLHGEPARTDAQAPGQENAAAGNDRSS